MSLQCKIRLIMENDRDCFELSKKQVNNKYKQCASSLYTYLHKSLAYDHHLLQ